MNQQVEILAELAAKLTPNERVELIERINLTLLNEPEEIDPAWEAEIERRVAQLDRGEAVLHDADGVMAELRARCA